MTLGDVIVNYIKVDNQQIKPIRILPMDYSRSTSYIMHQIFRNEMDQLTDYDSELDDDIGHIGFSFRKRLKKAFRSGRSIMKKIRNTFKKAARKVKKATVVLSKGIASRSKKLIKRGLRSVKRLGRSALKFGSRFVKRTRRTLRKIIKKVGRIPSKAVNAARFIAKYASDKAKKLYDITKKIGAKAVKVIKSGFEFTYNKTVKPLIDKIDKLFNIAKLINDKIQRSGVRNSQTNKIMQKFQEISSRYIFIQKMLNKFRLTKGKSISDIGDLGITVTTGVVLTLVAILTAFIATLSSFIKNSQAVADNLPEGAQPTELPTGTTVTTMPTGEPVFRTPGGALIPMTESQSEYYEPPPPESYAKANELNVHAQAAEQAGNSELAKLYRQQAQALIAPRKKSFIKRMLDKKIASISIKYVILGIIAVIVLIKMYPYLKPHMSRMMSYGRERLHQLRSS